MIKENINTINTNRAESNWFCGLVDHSGEFVIDKFTNKLYFEIKIFNKNTSHFLIDFLEKNVVKGQVEKFDEFFEYHSYRVYNYYEIKKYIFPLLYNDQSFNIDQAYKSQAKYKLLTSKYFQALLAETYIDGIISNKINGKLADFDTIPSLWSPFLIDGLNSLYSEKEKQLIFAEFLKYLLFFYQNHNISIKDIGLLFHDYFLNKTIKTTDDSFDWVKDFMNGGWMRGFFENSVGFNIRYKGSKIIHKSPSREFSLTLYKQSPFDLLCYIILLKIYNINLTSKKNLPIFKQIKKNNINFFKLVSCNNQSCQSIVYCFSGNKMLQVVDQNKNDKSTNITNINSITPIFHGYIEKLFQVWGNWPTDEKNVKFRNQQKIFYYLELKKLKNLYNGK